LLAYSAAASDSLADAQKLKWQLWFAKRATEAEPKNVTYETRKNQSLKLLLKLLCVLATAVQCQAAERPNVLFIAIDDLRPELGCYDSPIAVSPNLDALAKNGLLFNRAYCQQAICRPSRASLMTGARPETTGLFHNYVSLRELQPNILTLPQHFIA
jgi:iduronate 2-sulfatase